MEPGSTFCILPWTHLFASERGLIFPCCVSAAEDKPLCDENGKAFKASEADHFAKAWNSEQMRKLRQAMLASERPSVCRTCYEREDLGAVSYRKDSNEEFKAHIAAAISSTRSDGSAPMNIKSADIRVGNNCNLRCRMCSPAYSRKLLEEHQLISKTPYNAEMTHELRTQNWYKSERFWSHVEELAPQLERINLAGGEPLLSQEATQLIERLSKTKHAKRLKLIYNTNMTHLPERLLDVWPRFASTVLICSIDGYKDLNGYIRYPSNWDKIEQNLQMLHSDARKVAKVTVSFNITVQVYNILRLRELINYLCFSYPRFLAPSFGLLREPEYFSVQVLPKKLKELASERLGGINLVKSRRLELTEQLAAIVKYLNAEDKSELWPEFQRATQIYDSKRGQSLRDIVPELCEQ